MGSGHTTVAQMTAEAGLEPQSPAIAGPVGRRRFKPGELNYDPAPMLSNTYVTVSITNIYSGGNWGRFRRPETQCEA